VHWLTRSLLILITLIGGITIFLPSRQCTSIALREDNTWLLDENMHQYAGQLGSGCYRSMLLVVLVIKPPDGLRRHAVVWRDSLPASDFSALHIRLALTPTTHLR